MNNQVLHKLIKFMSVWILLSLKQQSKPNYDVHVFAHFYAQTLKKLNLKQNVRIWTSGFRLWDPSVYLSSSVSIYMLMTSYPDTDFNMQEFLPPCFLKDLFFFISCQKMGGGDTKRDRERELERQLWIASVKGQPTYMGNGRIHNPATCTD